ncbi:hypothetical protein ABENE_23455 [Asticcacaulis benevestitus DSM 16100 = ATCC BAA-896]|uniref:Transposase IS66 central domain-containing protein n=7 Tax=Asticcacaulis TaxID=76890 RepID=V4N2B9_9CAUL|nr:transposase [Asticcacaulis benevestitus]ESQ75932.1 hypothetical protein ABENE_23455 [Asticcacaulis benevestitus DSM 16100 = ATCC BAA-896]
MAPSTESNDDFSLAGLRSVVATLLGQVERLQTEVGSQAKVIEEQSRTLEDLKLAVTVRDAKIAEQADEIARLKGLPPRPKFPGKPSGMETSTSKPLGGKGKRRKPGRGSKRDKLTVTAEVKLKALGVPAGSRFRGYEDVTVQDLHIEAAVTRYRRERWETPDGKRIVADIPAGVMGGFGPQLRQFIAAAHYQGQVTSERLVSLLNGMGLDISKRQVVRFLSEGLEDLITEDQDVLKAGLETASWISVDDTGARHNRQDAYTTQFGDGRFTVFRTGPTKSRRRFLYDLQCGRQDYVINEVAQAHMQRLNLPEPLIAKLWSHPDKRFSSEASFTAHLKSLGFDALKITPDPTKVATEAALWAAVKEQGRLDGTVVISDGAGQFRVEDQALCWVHAERLIYKLQPENAAHRKAVELIRTLIWWFYRDLKAYKLCPDTKRARMMRVRFDRIFTKKTGYILLDQQLRRLHRRKENLLRVLDRPDIPLHTNGSENDIRSIVTKRKISGGTMSDAGKAARDAMLGLMKTCAKLKISFYRFLGDRFTVQDAPYVQKLPTLVRLAAT